MQLLQSSNHAMPFGLQCIRRSKATEAQLCLLRNASSARLANCCNGKITWLAVGRTAKLKGLAAKSRGSKATCGLTSELNVVVLDVHGNLISQWRGCFSPREWLVLHMYPNGVLPIFFYQQAPRWLSHAKCLLDWVAMSILMWNG